MNTKLTMNDFDKRAKLSSLWVLVFPNMIFRGAYFPFELSSGIKPCNPTSSFCF